MNVAIKYHYPHQHQSVQSRLLLVDVVGDGAPDTADGSIPGQTQFEGRPRD